ncbi:MFS transporter [Adlercreutzia equolifaciens subsp. celatus]|uniref:MFS transporter n=1 Tax=Adlercreutzia equolifaciens TaxID=446660 RepID=UPI00194EEAF0|nr:MFS transporter [Adlercreutzia equolifaciens]BCS57359.1 MFS transporter [Adlercreutzia equolifaciens subsp. celatus]
MATTILTAEGATRRTETTAKATYAPLVVLALAQIGTSSDSAAMNLATASLVGTLGATLDDIQMATTLFSLIAGAFMIAGGLIGVTIGLRRTLAIGLSLAALGEITAALSPAIFSFTWGGRVVTGLGVCLVTPSVLGLVAALYQGRQRAIAFGTIAGAAALSTLSPLILGIVMDSSGFRLTFAIMAAYFVVVLCCARLIPRTPASGGHTHFDVAGTVVAALGMGLVLFGVAHLSDWGIASPPEALPLHLVRAAPPTLPAIVVGLVLLGLLVPTERRAQRRGNPLIPRAFVTSPSVRAGLSAVALPFFYMGAVGILATPYLQLVTGFTALQTGMLSLLSGIPMFLLATFLPKLAPHLSSRLIIRVGFIAIACACGLMALGVQQHGVTTALFGGMALGGFGVGAVNSQSNNAVACAVTRKEAEQSGGIQGAARSIGLALGTALAGTFLLLTMAGGFAAQVASAGIDQSYVAPAAETASTLMSDSAFSDEARTWRADAAQVDKLVDVKASAQADAMRLSFGALGLLMAAGLLTTRHLVETAAPRAKQDKAKARRPR